MTDFRNVAFSGQLDLRYIDAGPDRHLWRLLDAFGCEWHGGSIVAPRGFVTDGPSVPKRFRSIVPITGAEWPASVVHDFLYVTEPDGWTREMADDLFLAGLKASGVGRLKRNLMYSAVRVGGASLWARGSDDLVEYDYPDVE